VKRSVDKMYYAAVCCGHIMEEDQSSPLSPSYEGYPFFQFLAKYRPNAPDEKLKIKGLARNLKDPQREINKSKSQFLHIVSTAANSGWVGDRDALSDPKKKDLEQMGSKPGVCVWKKPGSELTQISPPGLPLAQKMRGEDATQDIKEIAGINTDALAIQDKTTSGKAIALRIKQAITILAKMFKNFRLTRELVGGALVNMIPNIFDVRKLEKTLGQQFLEENQIGRGYLKAFLTQIEDGRFDLVITEADSSATVRLETFDQLMEMQKAGVPIPPDLAIEFSSIPNSKEILERIKAYATEQANAEGEGNRRP